MTKVKKFHTIFDWFKQSHTSPLMTQTDSIAADSEEEERDYTERKDKSAIHLEKTARDKSWTTTTLFNLQTALPSPLYLT